MSRTILVVPTGHGAGLTATCLGLLHGLDRLGISVGYYKPVAQRTPTGAADDHSNDLVKLLTALEAPEPLDADHVERSLGNGDIDDILEEVVGRGQPVFDAYGVTVVQGLAPGSGLVYSNRLNAAMARALDADVVLVGSAPIGEPLNVERLADAMALTTNLYRTGESVRVVGCVVNRLPDTSDDAIAGLTRALDRHKLPLVGVNAYEAKLTWPRTRDVIEHLGARVLHEGDLDRRIADVVVCAQAVPGLLDWLRDDTLVIVPGDRHEVIMAACLTALNGTRLSALMLTVGVEPDPRVWELTEAARTSGLPILLTEEMTYRTATATADLSPEIPPDDRERAEAVANVIADGLNGEWLASLGEVQTGTRRRTSPAAFRHRLGVLAQAANKRIVLPEGNELRTIRAAAECAERGLARPVLLANPDEVAELARRNSITIGKGVEIIDPETIAGNYVDRLVELRGAKGVNESIAINQLDDTIMVGTMMLERGEVDGLVSGAVHTTAHTIRPALQIVRTAPDARLVSSLFFMLLPDDVLIYADCAVNPDPDAEQLADIALQTAGTAKAFGIEPRVAMISFSTGDSGSGSDVEKVAAATALVKERDPDLQIDGPLQYDAASVASVALTKRPGSAVAGRANVFIFPDLNTGNTTYKAVQRSADVVSIGPVLQGLAKPVNDLSRGSLVEDIIYTITVTAIQAAAQ